MRRPRRPASELRIAVDCMPAETKQAMLDAVEGSRIIVGAYTDREGGVCPMLAAHRNGGRTTFASFARAWDRYTHAGNGARTATDREVRTLTAMLEASIAIDDVRGGTVLSEAIADHRDSQMRRARREEHAPVRPGKDTVETRPDTGERDRTPELSRRHGWAWLRPFKRLDEYERAMDQLREAGVREAGDRDRELV